MSRETLEQLAKRLAAQGRRLGVTKPMARCYHQDIPDQPRAPAKYTPPGTKLSPSESGHRWRMKDDRVYCLLCGDQPGRQRRWCPNSPKRRRA